MRQLLITLALIFPAAAAQAESPVLECYDAAYQWLHHKECAIRLCAGATSIEPVDCAKDAYSRLYSQPLAVELCSARPATGDGSSKYCR